MATVREVLTNKIQRLRDRKQRLQADIVEINALIDQLQALKDGLTAGDEDKLAQLQGVAIIKAED